MTTPPNPSGKAREFWEIYKPDSERILGLSVLADELPVGASKLYSQSAFEKLQRELELAIEQRDEARTVRLSCCVSMEKERDELRAELKLLNEQYEACCAECQSESEENFYLKKQLREYEHETETVKELRAENEGLKNAIAESDDLREQNEALKAEHAKFCEDAQEKTDADFKLVREKCEQLKKENESLRELIHVTDESSLKAICVRQKGELAKLEVECERLKEERDLAVTANELNFKKYVDACEALKAQLADFREALEWYASGTSGGSLDLDDGDRAREVLAKHSTPKGSEE